MSIDPAELERLASRALRALPTPRAPGSLVGRVLTAMSREAARPWYARPWRTWPLAWQLASAFAIVLVAVGSVLAVPGVLAALGQVAPAMSLSALVESIGPLRVARPLWDATVVVWRLVVQPVAPYVVLFVLIMSFSCIAFGTALDRVVALGGASRS